MVKVDIFIFKADAFGRSQFARRTPRQLGQDDPVSIYVASAEDTVLAKLQWYREGAVCRTASGPTCSGCSKSRARLRPRLPGGMGAGTGPNGPAAPGAR